MRSSLLVAGGKRASILVTDMDVCEISTIGFAHRSTDAFDHYQICHVHFTKDGPVIGVWEGAWAPRANYLKQVFEKDFQLRCIPPPSAQVKVGSGISVYLGTVGNSN
ncbi:hypothetical protein [Absidia glauca]|uniref:Uncharacterized protein n=1 Tax=Absidia glauca TaxID=4829 RepID=A0A168QWQ1_ABSGL|nr:hypothetical protein [Absidia glauca]